MASYPDTRLLIANTWRDGASGKTLEVLNPATGQPIGTVAWAERSDLDAALQAAEQGFALWRHTTVYERAAVMRRAASLLRERAPQIAPWLTLEQGKPLAEARAEVLAAADIIDWFADEGRRVYGRIVPGRDPANQQLVLKQPVGPVAAFTPWNFPINQVVRKVSAALATGCSFLCKAPEETPAAPAALLQCFVDAGTPPGVVGLVFGHPAEISRYLIAHPVIRKITFTGSTAVGKELAALAGQHMKRATMELGGHAPVIIAQDADIERAAQICGAAKFRNAGQVCISPTRFLVHHTRLADFSEALASYARQLQVGDGLQAATTLGPLANPRRLQAMTHIVADAQSHGARLITGGTPLGEQGHFFAPTVLADVGLGAELFNQEPFGPVAGIRGFDTLDEAIAEANRLPYGLAAYGFTRAYGTLQRLAHELDVGMVWMNQAPTTSAEMPFGGIKDSGYGSEGGPEALEAYLNTKSVALRDA